MAEGPGTLCPRETPALHPTIPYLKVAGAIHGNVHEAVKDALVKQVALDADERLGPRVFLLVLHRRNRLRGKLRLVPATQAARSSLL
jgi:hypothetical protein